jgi:hypothetical protein
MTPSWQEFMDGLARQCDHRCWELSKAPLWPELESLSLSSLQRGGSSAKLGDEGWAPALPPLGPGNTQSSWGGKWKDPVTRSGSSYWCSAGLGDVGAVDGGTWRQDHPKVPLSQPTLSHHYLVDCSRRANGAHNAV